MRRQIFLTHRRDLLSRWLKAFPKAESRPFPTRDMKPMCKRGEALVWLHVDTPSPNLEAVIQLTVRLLPDCPVVVLANVPSEPEGYAALKAGASGYANTVTAPELLQQIALVVENGGIWVGRDLKSRLLGALAPVLKVSGQAAQEELDGLSPRQLEVARAVATGASNKEVARALDITERTVKAHLSSIFEQLGVRDRVQLALLVNAGRDDYMPGKQRAAN